MIPPLNRRSRARPALPPPGAAPIFAALGDATRLRIVARLCDDGPLSIARLSEDASISRQAITKHLQALAAAGLVISRRAGREHLWALEGSGLTEARRYLDAISARWDDALVRLRAYVEDDGS
ncbi:ArsR/SmtB family transcription factor [Bordetella flabilis]|uniref:Transcriptional regulator n=1 Tax=Bordetella flabilis TaxID=463014 RepID=A0A193GDZ9_9BORD|nr:metalloregulator ArsR/SmtB family transcription factor [Bordetella flabilis]ANN77514.1 transcriptional regulator [Bordetella flabilis]